MVRRFQNPHYPQTNLAIGDGLLTLLKALDEMQSL